jgi:hypothetical protein
VADYKNNPLELNVDFIYFSFVILVLISYKNIILPKEVDCKSVNRRLK